METLKEAVPLWPSPGATVCCVFSDLAPEYPSNCHRGAALSHWAHTAHNGGDMEGLCFSGLNIPNEFISFWEKHCLVQSTKFPGLSLPGSILNTPVGIFGAARRRDAVCFVLFSTPSWLFPVCWFPWQNLTETGFGLGLHAAWEGAKHMHTNTQQTLQQHGFEPCRLPYMDFFFSVEHYSTT